MPFPCAALAVLLLLAAASAKAGDMCPAPPKHSPLGAVMPLPVGDHMIHLDSDAATMDGDGHVTVTGRVKVRQDARTVSADTMNYDIKTGKLAVKGSVDFEDPKLGVKSDSGNYDALGGAEFDEAYFRIFDRRGRGFARDMQFHPDGKIALELVRYTTCPVGNADWMLEASSIDLDTTRQEGVGHGVLMRFKNVPIFYTPYISFPLGNERKSGVLFPSFSHSTSDGYQLELPYYFNLAPNYDLTLTPGYMTARGVQLGEEFRFLTTASHGLVQGNFLPNDKQAHSDRTYFHALDVTDFQAGWRFDADITSVSDVNYFSNFAVGSEQTSVTFLERRVELLYNDDVWRVRGELQNFQTIDIELYDFERPYSRLPRIEAEGLYPIANTPVELALNAEATYFVRKKVSDAGIFQAATGSYLATPNGARLDVSPEVRWSSRGPGYFFEPAVGYHFTQYDLQDAAAGSPSTPSRQLPFARLDAGLVFDRDAGAHGQRTETLEPRVVYSYVPYRNQDSLPVFDTALPDLNLTELFRTNRFVGNDRIGDANQLAAGLTTRLFDTVSGAQYLSATVGQIRYFSIPRVTLPQAPLLLGAVGSSQFLAAPVIAAGQVYTTPNGNLAVAQPGQFGQIGERYPASDIVTEVALTAYKHVSVDLDYQWNPYTSHSDKQEIGVQYHPDAARVVNLSYRLQTGILKQYDGSVVWPITDHWNTIGRWVYSLRDRETIEQVAGIEYKSCCYRIQIVQRRYLQRPDDGSRATLSTSFALQLELTGLSSVGKAADSYLQKEIRGYPVRDSSNLDAP